MDTQQKAHPTEAEMASDLGAMEILVCRRLNSMMDRNHIIV
jgi:hypothetical protein